MALPGYGSRDSDTAKKNYDAIEYGNRHGAISFGKINQKANTTNAVLLETPDAKHCMYMIEDGDEKGNSTFLTPAKFGIQCGEWPEIDDREEKSKKISFAVVSNNGDIVLKAENGKIILDADSIEFHATGEGETKGDIDIRASNNIKLESPNLICGHGHTKMVTTGKIEVCANSCLNIYSSIIRGVTDAVAVKDSKVGGKQICNKFNEDNY